MFKSVQLLKANLIKEIPQINDLNTQTACYQDVIRTLRLAYITAPFPRSPETNSANCAIKTLKALVWCGVL